MTQALQRDAVRTRRALLDAAAKTIATHGAAVSLEVIAREAGVSKGGLLHHFRSKEALLVGLVEEWLARFDAAVRRHLDPNDHRPGGLFRAHIRATFDDSPEMVDELWRNPAVLTALLGVPDVLQRAQVHDRMWRQALADDGLHPQRAAVIMGMLDGCTMSDLLGNTSTKAEREDTRALLLALTDETGPVVSQG
ncbi:TetR/AcrR family transcriptional regulator [Micromonospora endolithica]|nr:TetR/AcrR family transcriptional regulator [Micromonospora endolithica]TWJ25211.1 TetR family transcriptional regulator [Micromonospora endolithica]